MESITFLAPFERALSQSQELLLLAQNADWDAFEVLVQQRHESLLDIRQDDFIRLVEQAQMGSQVALIIDAIQSINKQLEVLAAAHSDQIASDLRQVSKAVKALDAYCR